MKQKAIESKGVWLFLFMTAWVLLWRDAEWMAVLGAAALHEGGHLLTAKLCGVKVKGVRLGFFGARMGLEGLLPYGKEFLIAAGGPLVNLLCSGGIWLLRCGSLAEGWTLFFYASLGLGFLNLLPVGTMDGGRMLTAALSRFFSSAVAERCVGVTTAVCLGGLWMLTVYGLLRGAPVVSLSVFFLYLVLRNCFSGEGG